MDINFSDMGWIVHSVDCFDPISAALDVDSITLSKYSSPMLMVE